MTTDDPYDLRRFLAAQDDGTYEQALRELLSGRKRSHWMWFVFPQITGLGHSPMAQRYALSGVAEAQAYAAHPTLGPRLLACCHALIGLPGGDPVRVLGAVDAQKLHSSMTLFHIAVPEESAFQDVLDRYFDGADDGGTMSRL